MALAALTQPITTLGIAKVEPLLQTWPSRRNQIYLNEGNFGGWVKTREKGVKVIDCVSSIKSKLKDTGKSNSPKSRKESEKAAVVKKNYVVSKSKVAAVVSEKSTVVNESVVKSIENSTVVKERDVTSKVGKSNVSAVVSERSAVDEKDNPKVSKVSDESNKATVVVPIIDKVLVATETDKETEPVVVADVKAPVVAAVESVVKKDNPKVTSKVLDESVKATVIKKSVKVPVVKKSVKVSSVVTDKPSSVVADKIDVVVKKSVKASSVVADKTSSVVADKVDVVVKKSVKASSVVADKVDVVKDKVDVVADKASDALKNKPTVKGKEACFLRLSKQEENPEVKAKIDTKSIKRLISKLEKKVKKQESDEDSVPKKGKKKLTKKVEKEVSDEESLPKKGDKIKVTPSKIHEMLGVPFGGYSLFDLDEREADHEFVRKWAGQFYPLELKKVRVNDIARTLIAAQEIDFLFKVNFLTLFTNTMGKADGLKGQICLDVVRRLREDSMIYDKIGSKPDKNGKRVKAGKSLK
uniref:Ulp1 protease family, C-terminal catalytic domain-containing protein n=1 Tax=Tanacetum cinerariifolium TaxID=118510 RepID=A0A699H173_TANCI|nr:hypothetical protein [Tanacetum cinerariifolium]